MRKTTWNIRSRWEDNTNMHLYVSGWSADCINLAQDSDKWPELVNSVMKFPVAENEGHYLIS